MQLTDVKIEDESSSYALLALQGPLHKKYFKN